MLFQFVLLRLTNSFGDGRGRDIRKKGKKKSTDLYDILLMFHLIEGWLHLLL